MLQCKGSTGHCAGLLSLAVCLATLIACNPAQAVPQSDAAEPMQGLAKCQRLPGELAADVGCGCSRQ